MDKDDGGPAFPVKKTEPGIHEGMSLRDYFAARAIPEMIRLSMDEYGGWSVENVAHGCYNLADAMLKARGE